MKLQLAKYVEAPSAVAGSSVREYVGKFSEKMKSEHPLEVLDIFELEFRALETLYDEIIQDVDEIN